MSTHTDSTLLKTLADVVASQGVTSQVLLKAGGGTVSVLAFGEGERLATHTVPFEVLIVVMDGEASVTLDGSVHRVMAGQVIRLPPDVPHAVHAPVDMRMLLVRLRP